MPLLPQARREGFYVIQKRLAIARTNCRRVVIFLYYALAFFQLRRARHFARDRSPPPRQQGFAVRFSIKLLSQPEEVMRAKENLLNDGFKNSMQRKVLALGVEATLL